MTIMKCMDPFCGERMHRSTTNGDVVEYVCRTCGTAVNIDRRLNAVVGGPWVGLYRRPDLIALLDPRRRASVGLASES